MLLGGEITWSERKLGIARVVSVVAATFIALACGTNVHDSKEDFHINVDMK